MKKRNVVLLLMSMMGFVAVTLCSCWGGSRVVMGVIAGELLDRNGPRIGYKSAVLLNVETGESVENGNRAVQQDPQNFGVFFFKDLKGGTYSIEFFDNAGIEIPVEPFEVELGNGRTKTIVVTVLPDEE